MRTYTRRTPQGDGTEPWHGTLAGYASHRCGCRRCRANWAAYWTAYRADPQRKARHNQVQRQTSVRRRKEYGL